MKYFFTYLFVGIGCLLMAHEIAAQNSQEIASKLFSQCKQINTLKYTMKKIERIKGEMISQQSTVKLNNHPLKVYLFQEAPKSGLEVLYVEGTNNNQALINTNGFPWISINLDPYGGTMRSNQHHTLLNSGYDHVIGILEFLFTKYQSEIQSMIKIDGSVVWDKHNCWAVTLTNPHFKYIPYTVQQGETILTIASKYRLSEDMILDKNPKISSYGSVKAGEVIIIPSDYSNKMVLYIDKVRNIPLFMKVYDDKGLYEQYEYYNVSVNCIFKADEFTRDFKDYNF
jgi:outer membrane lipoprotein-sorting protein